MAGGSGIQGAAAAQQAGGVAGGGQGSPSQQDAAQPAAGEAAPPAPAAPHADGSEASHGSSKDGKAGGKALAKFDSGLLQREASGPSPHYDPSREIVLRYEFLSSRAIKVRRRGARALASGARGGAPPGCAVAVRSAAPECAGAC